MGQIHHPRPPIPPRIKEIRDTRFKPTCPDCNIKLREISGSKKDIGQQAYGCLKCMKIFVRLDL